MDVLAEVERSGFVESRHRGVAVRVDPSGQVDWAVGDPGAVIFPRSSNKPLQAIGLLRAGLPLDGRLLAVATSSHSGEPVHVEAVREVLGLAGLDESALLTPPSYPLDPHEHARVLREGGGRAPILMDCSGKHAAMLLTCREHGWPVDDYLAPEHPVQQAVTAAFVDLTGSAPEVVGTDGCGAPLLGTTVAGLAAAFGRIVRRSTPESARLVDAMVAHPQMVSGSRRTERRFMEAFGGAIVKSGAESVLAMALPDGTAWAVKIEDGGERALYVALARALQVAGLDHPLLDERPEVLGGGRPVGAVRPTF
ncbi:L-asparaginase, thermolabile [Aeromicrobium marinum DSM 15272]|uniref:L-asparaginase, thermolabile n=1 Tax=Aeromicrobium marinum DSM 15272 TaxID=585531 RepID=E2SEW4_9ACTN|nr:asparaginase [Aeromicrobium marinum]EFQ82411.1 L-asparaginase, thermolabile [Aeromicrobium marinum DSM 15272]